MKREEIKEKVVEMTVNLLGVDKEDVNDETVFVDDLGADSLDMAELCINFEKEFGIRLEDDNFEKVRTVSDVIGLIDQIKND